MTDPAVLSIPIPDLHLRATYWQAANALTFLLEDAFPDAAAPAMRRMRATLQTGDWITQREHLGAELLHDIQPWLGPADETPVFYDVGADGEPHPTPLARLLAAHLRGVTSRVAGITEQQWSAYDARFTALAVAL